MNTFSETADIFETFLTKNAPFPDNPSSLYAPCEYILKMGGKRIRPSVCLMANELFSNINPDTYWVAAAIEIFHNFTLVHDDIMDKAPLRRGQQTVHKKYSTEAAILSGDVMNIYAYDCLSKIDKNRLPEIFHLFNKTAIEVCEGQQLDMDYEQLDATTVEEYIKMITLKTSVLLATSMKSGAILGNAPENDTESMYEFGKNLGIAFQLQDDYLDTFGESEKTGKQVGGDIKENKKTFLLIKAKELAKGENEQQLNELIQSNKPEKVNETILLFKQLGINQLTLDEIEHYFNIAKKHLDAIQVDEEQKVPFRQLLDYLFNREH